MRRRRRKIYIASLSIRSGLASALHKATEGSRERERVVALKGGNFLSEKRRRKEIATTRSDGGAHSIRNTCAPAPRCAPSFVGAKKELETGRRRRRRRRNLILLTRSLLFSSASLLMTLAAPPSFHLELLRWWRVSSQNAPRCI